MGMIAVNNLTVHYGAFCAVNNISFRVKKGELFALLGTNGAGKTTTIQTLCMLKQSSGGAVLFHGKPLADENTLYKNRLAVVFQNSVLDAKLTVRENLITRGSLYHIPLAALKQNIALYAQKLEMDDILDKPFGNLSGGQKRKADLAKALITNPEFLILDEPTTGLDPHTRALVWDVMHWAKKEKNLTILLTTHYMEETAQADYVVIMHQSNILAEGTPDQLKEHYAFDTLKLYPAAHQKQAVEQWLGEQGIAFLHANNHIEVHTKFDGHIYTWLAQLQPYLTHFELTKGNMDTVFLNVTGVTEEQA